MPAVPVQARLLRRWAAALRPAVETEL